MHGIGVWRLLMLRTGMPLEYTFQHGAAQGQATKFDMQSGYISTLTSAKRAPALQHTYEGYVANTSAASFNAETNVRHTSLKHMHFGLAVRVGGRADLGWTVQGLSFHAFLVTMVSNTYMHACAIGS